MRTSWTPAGSRRRRPFVAVAVCLGLLAACASDGGGVACGAIEEILEAGSGTHVVREDAAVFEYHPPTSGAHRAVYPPPGVRDEPVPEVDQVAALEGGFVIFHYDPDVVTGTDLRRLETLTEGQEQVILTPAADGIDGGKAVAFTAWGVRQRCDGVSRSAAESFRDRYVGAVDANDF